MRAFQVLREQDVQKPAGFRVQDAFPQIGKISFWLEVCVGVCVCVGLRGGWGCISRPGSPRKDLISKFPTVVVERLGERRW